MIKRSMEEIKGQYYYLISQAWSRDVLSERLKACRNIMKYSEVKQLVKEQAYEIGARDDHRTRNIY